MSKSHEAFWWGLFSQGGVMAALFVPGLILATGFFIAMAEPAAAYDQLHAVVGNILVKLVLLAVLALSFFHCAHRIRHTLHDLGVHGAKAVLYLLCYGGALAGSIAAAALLFRI